MLVRFVGLDAEGKPPSLAVLHLALRDDQGFDHVEHEFFQVGHDPEALDIADRPADVGGAQVENFPGHRRVATNAQVGSQHDDGEVHAAEQVGQIVVQLVQFRVAVLQLLVDGGQLLVGGLQFRFGGLEFLVCALQLFVARFVFFVGRAQFRVGCLLLLDDGLKVFLRGRQLPFQVVRSTAVGRRFALPVIGAAGLDRGGRLRRLRKQHQEVNLRGGRALDREHCQIDPAFPALVSELEAVATNGRARLYRFRHRRPQVLHQALPGHFEEVEARLGLARCQVRAGAPPELHDLHRLVDQNSGRRVTGQHDAIGLFMGVKPARALGGPATDWRRRVGLLPVRPPGWIFDDQRVANRFPAVGFVFPVHQGK